MINAQIKVRVLSAQAYLATMIDVGMGRAAATETVRDDMLQPAEMEANYLTEWEEEGAGADTKAALSSLSCSVPLIAETRDKIEKAKNNMASKLDAEATQRVLSNLAGGKLSHLLVPQFVSDFQKARSKIQSLSGVKPSFVDVVYKPKTLNELMELCSIECLLKMSVEEIRAGHYHLSPDLAAEICVKPEGSLSRGEWAAFLFIWQSKRSDDRTVQGWASSAIREVGPRLKLSWEVVRDLTFDDIKRELKPRRPKQVEEDQSTLRSWGAQGQTKKPGAHSESRHR